MAKKTNKKSKSTTKVAKVKGVVKRWNVTTYLTNPKNEKDEQVYSDEYLKTTESEALAYAESLMGASKGRIIRFEVK